MDDDSLEDTAGLPDSNRPKRAGPTIDLEASEVSGDTRKAGAGTERGRSFNWPSRAAISATLVAALCGGATAALIIAAVWFSGYSAPPPMPTAAPQADTAAVDDLTSRVAGIEAHLARPAAAVPDSVAAARIEALEKSVVALRGELAGQRAQAEKLAADIAALKSAPRESSAAPDLSDINDRLAQLERAARTQGAEIAQESAKPADDAQLRRVVVASLLDLSVRQSEPYGAALAAAKPLAENPDVLKPLNAFADTGVPSAATLSRELLNLVPKLSPPASENATTGSGLVDRLEAGAARLVRIERTDAAVGNDRGAVVARVTAAALRNDSNEARRELNTLAPSDRAAAQSWIEKADARDAALAASHQFATAALAALAQPRP
jgi:hypothetical protein